MSATTTTTTLADGTQVVERIITETETYYTIRHHFSERKDGGVASFGSFATQEDAEKSLTDEEKATGMYAVTLVSSTYQRISKTSYTEV